MPPIPVYLKTADDAPRPDDAEFFWLTRDGAFLCRNHSFFASDVKTDRPIRALSAHKAGVVVRYPKVESEMLESVVGFFGRVYEMHHSEAIVLLVWDARERRYLLNVPEQEASVWRSGQYRSPQDVKYKVPALPPGQLLVGDIHSHGNMAAFTSWTDANDERHRDGIHAIIGRVESEPPELHVDLAVDGDRFALRPEEIFEGYEARRADIPPEWLDRVRVREYGWRDWYDYRDRREEAK
jgi:PRTRC genetic system protein A